MESKAKLTVELVEELCPVAVELESTLNCPEWIRTPLLTLGSGGTQLTWGTSVVRCPASSTLSSTILRCASVTHSPPWLLESDPESQVWDRYKEDQGHGLAESDTEIDFSGILPNTLKSSTNILYYIVNEILVKQMYRNIKKISIWLINESIILLVLLFSVTN